jgi:hypothetical protein
LRGEKRVFEQKRVVGKNALLKRCLGEARCLQHLLRPPAGMLPVFLFLYAFALLWIFYALCILCDDHLVPAVDVFIKQFEVPEEVAGRFIIS